VGSYQGAAYLESAIWNLLFAIREARSYLSSSVMTRMTTNARMKLRSTHRGRSGPESATQATTAKMRQISDQDSIVRRRCGCFAG